MASTIWYLLQLFAFLLGGMAFAKTPIVTPSWDRHVDRLLSWCLYLLLFAMGIRTGLIEGIYGQAGRMGMLALAFAAASSIGSIVLVMTSTWVFNRSRTRTCRTAKSVQVSWLRRLKEPLKLVGSAALGMLGASLTPWFGWFHDGITSTLLFILLMLVGMQMVLGRSDLFSVFRQPISLLLPVLTIAGTLMGGWIVGIMTELTSGQSMAIAAGFGWYSLSGVLIADMGDPMLGSVAFLSNLLRELLACITIPLLAGISHPHAAISVGGATSMDVTLPIIEHSCGGSYVPLSLAHGIMLTIAVPFLVPLLFVL